MTYTIITPKAVQKQLDALPNEVWDSNESTDEFLTFLRQQRSIEPIETL